MAITLRLNVDWDFPSVPYRTLLILQISVSIKDLFRLGKEYPWRRPESCPRCGHVRLWGHGFVSAYFDGYESLFWLRRYRCPLCRVIVRLRPAGYFQRFHASIEMIRDRLTFRITHYRWPPESSRQQQGHWFRSLLRKAKLYLGLDGFEGLMGAFDALLSQGITPVSRSI